MYDNFQKNIMCLNTIFPGGFPGGSDGKESACSAGDPSSIPGFRRSPGEGNGYLLQYSCLKNSMDRGAWWATAHGGPKELDRTEQLTLSLSQGNDEVSYNNHLHRILQNNRKE